MKSVFEFVKLTVIGGLVVLLPAAVVFVILERVFVTVRAALAPLAARLPITVVLPGLIAAVIVVGACFLVGAAVRTRPGRKVVGAIEQRVPGYTVLRNLSQRMVGEADGITFATALARMESGLVPCFLVEEHQDGSYTVFFPAVPTPTVGSVSILPRDRVHPLDVPFRSAIKCFTQWGAGSGELLRAMRRPPPGRATTPGAREERC